MKTIHLRVYNVLIIIILFAILLLLFQISERLTFFLLQYDDRIPGHYYDYHDMDHQDQMDGTTQSYEVNMEEEITSAIKGSPKKFLTNFKNPCWISELHDLDPYSQNHYRGTNERFSNAEWLADVTLDNMTSRLRSRQHAGDHWRMRCIPLVYILGVTKGGTTDLYTQLLRHPLVVGGAIKEPMWWNRKRLGSDKVGFSDYVDLYDSAADTIRNHIKQRNMTEYHPMITVDASPAYFWDYDGWQTISGNEGLSEPRFTMAHSLKAALPHAKLVVLLRNPIDRLYSQFRMWWPDASFMEFHTQARKAVELMYNCMANRTVRSCAYDASVNPRETRKPGRIYLRASMYDVFVSDWMAVFPPEQLLILRAEDYFKIRKKILGKIFDFLGLPPMDVSILQAIDNSEIIHAHSNNVLTASWPILEITRTLLNGFFEPHIKNLAKILNDDRFLWNDTSS